MNIRIPSNLKREGDETLKRLGFTPSQAIRGLYEFIAKPRATRRRFCAS